MACARFVPGSVPKSCRPFGLPATDLTPTPCARSTDENHSGGYLIDATA